MALSDYILCCKCEVKLIYDGDRVQREWWEERFGKPPEIECPDCKSPASKPWVGLTEEEDWIAIDEQARKSFQRHKTSVRGQAISPADSFDMHLIWATEAKLREKNAQPSKPLTDEDIAAAMTGHGPIGVSTSVLRRIARAIEAAHGIKGDA